MREIPLTRGLVALVDDADYDALVVFSWHARPTTNLRPCTRRQNMQNRRRSRRPQSSPFRGVTWDKFNKKWRAQIRCGGEGARARQVYLGCYTSDRDAATAYDRAAIKAFGEFAATNFPREEYVDVA